MTLPSAETVRVPVPNTFPAFFTVFLTVLASTRCNDSMSMSGEPVTGYSLPSYLKVECQDIGDPSAATPLTVRATPCAVCAYVRVTDLAAGPGLNLDFATFSVQVPMIGSGASAAKATATVRKSTRRIVFTVTPYLEFVRLDWFATDTVRGSLRRSGGEYALRAPLAQRLVGAPWKRRLPWPQRRRRCAEHEAEP